MKKNFLLTLIFISITLLIQSQLTFADEREQKRIEEKYLPMFEKIESEAVIRLNNLIDEAYFEYEKKKENGEITFPLLISYVEKGKKLEEEIDEAFQAVLVQFKKEIREKNLPEDITYPYENQYVKSKRKNKLAILKNLTLEGHTIEFEREK